MKKLLIKLIEWYQHLPISTHKMCKYTPTCSEYMKISIERFGVIKGLSLGVIRILRCNPFSKGGYDPVPIQLNPKKCYNKKGDIMKNKYLTPISYIILIVTVILLYIFKDKMIYVSLIAGAGSFLYGIISIIKEENYGFLLSSIGLSLFTSAIIYLNKLLDLDNTITFMLSLSICLFMIISLVYNFKTRKKVLEIHNIPVDGTVCDLVRNPNLKKEYYEVIYSYKHKEKEYNVTHPGLMHKRIPAIGDTKKFFINSKDPLDVYFDKPKNEIARETTIEVCFIIMCIGIIISLFI